MVMFELIVTSWPFLIEMVFAAEVGANVASIHAKLSLDDSHVLIDVQLPVAFDLK